MKKRLNVYKNLSEFGATTDAEFMLKQAEAVVESKAALRKLADQVDGPFMLILPKDTKHGLETTTMVLLFGKPYQAALLLAAIYEAKQQFLEKLSHDLPEEMMRDLLKLDHDLARDYSLDGDEEEE